MKPVAEVELPGDWGALRESYRLDPVLLDASFQIVAAAAGERPVEDGAAWLPAGWSRLDWLRSPQGRAFGATFKSNRLTTWKRGRPRRPTSA